MKFTHFTLTLLAALTLWSSNAAASDCNSYAHLCEVRVVKSQDRHPAYKGAPKQVTPKVTRAKQQQLDANGNPVVRLYRGLGGRVFGMSVDRLGERIKQTCNADVVVGNWNAASATDLPGDKRRVVLIGHSMGALAVTRVAKQYAPMRVHLMVTLDPPAFNAGEVTGSTVKHVNYYQRQALLGRGIPKGSRKNVLVKTNHIGVVDVASNDVVRMACAEKRGARR